VTYKDINQFGGLLKYYPWIKPPNGWFCLNMNKASKGSNKLAYYEGLIRDDNGV